MALKSDGRIWAWGANGSGQLGNNTTADSLTPLQVNGLSNVTAVSAGSSHSLALKSDGSVWAWGANESGQLGNNTTTKSVVPVQVNGLVNVVAVAAGYRFSLALKSDGSVWAWGANGSGQLGNSIPVRSVVPVQVNGLTNVVAVAAGNSHSLALKADGSVWAWGANGSGQLGNNTTTGSVTPVQVNGLTNVVAVAAGSHHSVALKNDGSLRAWGANWSGQLGNSTTANSATPIQVEIVAAASKIAAGGSCNMALKEDGTLVSWGDGAFGQLGTGVSGSSSNASPVLGLNLLVASPTVSIIHPAGDTTGVLGQPIHFQVSASATAGTVTEVNYFNEGAKIGTSTTAPFDWAWTPNTWGDFQITAVAADSNGSTSLRSDIVTVHVAYDSDNSGLGDWWELANFGHLGVNPNADPDGDGFTNLQEREQGSDPKNYYDQGATTIAPVVSIFGGDNQSAVPGDYLSQPFSVQVRDGSEAGTLLINAPVDFAVAGGGGGLAGDLGNITTNPILTLRTGVDGVARAFYRHGAQHEGTSTITARAGNSNIVTFHAEAVTQDSDALIGHWKFDEASGNTILDSSGLHHDGVLGNGPVRTPGVFGGAILFSGTEPIATIASTSALDPGTDSFTLVTWFKADWSYEYRVLISKRGLDQGGYYYHGFSLGLNWDGQIDFRKQRNRGYLVRD
ncbi:MAG TPA: Ig-like domain-containing protein [Chthoniobacterales bacterium]